MEKSARVSLLEDDMVTHSVWYVFIFTLSIYFFSQTDVLKKDLLFQSGQPLRSCESLVRSERRGGPSTHHCSRLRGRFSISCCSPFCCSQWAFSLCRQKLFRKADSCAGRPVRGRVSRPHMWSSSRSLGQPRSLLGEVFVTHRGGWNVEGP